MSWSAFIFAAACWFVVGYIVGANRELNRLEKELDQLEKEVDEFFAKGDEHDAEG